MGTRVYFISDLHLGHEKILGFSPERSGRTTAEHDHWIITQWNSVVRESDIVYVLGDVAFSLEGLAKCALLNGEKRLVPGNHDRFGMAEYMKYFTVLPGLINYKEFWLSHAPTHPAELRGKINIHGHVHSDTIDDDRYINVCVEVLGGVPLFLDKLRNR